MPYLEQENLDRYMPLNPYETRHHASMSKFHVRMNQTIVYGKTVGCLLRVVAVVVTSQKDAVTEMVAVVQANPKNLQ